MYNVHFRTFDPSARPLKTGYTLSAWCATLRLDREPANKPLTLVMRDSRKMDDVPNGEPLDGKRLPAFPGFIPGRWKQLV